MSFDLLKRLGPEERDLLEWLSKEDFSQYGECHGLTFDRLLSRGLVQIHGPGEHQRFIANGTTMKHRAVSLTEAGREIARRMLGGEP